MEKVVRLFLLLILFLCIKPLWGENLFFLESAGSARSIGVGKAYTALTDRADSLLWNPAGLASSFKQEIQLTYSQDFNMVQNGFISGKMPLFSSHMMMGIGYIFSNVNDITGMNEDGNFTNNFSFLNHAFLLGVSMPLLTDVDMGITFKYIQKKIPDESNQGLSIDLGGKIRPISFLTLGCVLKDVTYPYIGPDRIYPSCVLGSDLIFFSSAFHVLTDLNICKTRPSQLNLGVEWTPLEFFSLRSGYENLSNFHAGLSLNLTGFILDYSFSVHPLDNSHRLTFTLM